MDGVIDWEKLSGRGNRPNVHTLKHRKLALIHRAKKRKMTNQKNPSWRLGLTGGFGCGKSRVAGVFADHGWKVIDTDALARDLLSGDLPTQTALRETWGAVIFDRSGHLDRAALAEIVFKDPAALQRLESILHPGIRQRWLEAVERASDQSCVVEIPLLFEKRLETHFHFTLCVAVSPDVQLARIAERGFTPGEARRRISLQMPLSEKISRADFLVWNDGSFAMTRAQVRQLLLDLSEIT